MLCFVSPHSIVQDSSDQEFGLARYFIHHIVLLLRLKIIAD